MIERVGEQVEPLFLDVDALVTASAGRLSAPVFDFLDGGADGEVTLRANRSALSQWSLVPRVCVDVEQVDVSSMLGDRVVPVPYFLAPSGAHRLFHPEAEFATATAARHTGVPYVTSTAASVSMEELANVAPDERWYQLYCFRDRDVVDDLIRRAETAGYRSLVVTVDAPVLGRRQRDLRNQFTVGPEIRWANLERYGLADLSDANDGTVVARFFAEQIDPTVTWDDIARITSSTSLPVFVKGVLSAQDATVAIDAGARGIYVSNHGGRQLDRVPATIEVLPDVRAAVPEHIPVLFDGGVRDAADLAIALASGAGAVGLGRLPLYALAADGRAGVEHCLVSLRRDLEHVLRLVGAARAVDLDHSYLRRCSAQSIER